MLAKAFGAAARLSGERLIAGFGAGWIKEEFDVVGVPYQAQGARLYELIEVTQKLWSGQMVEHHGRFYDIPSVQMSPAPTSPIPMFVGGHGGRRAAGELQAVAWQEEACGLAASWATLSRSGDLRARTVCATSQI